MTHGFDDQGSKFDGKGNLREWQTADDRKKFVERTDCEVDEYGGFEAAPAHDDMPQQKLNGKLTLGENTADNGGLRIAYMALLLPWPIWVKLRSKTRSTATPRSSASSLDSPRSGARTQPSRHRGKRALTDPHSPGEWRVNGAVQNSCGIPEGVGLQRRSADGERKRLPGVVRI